ncbi:MAG: Type 1 glutamine amidotransferase-like domain-containing protein [Clostridia bacterium]|nr:Type 1 glutamine amidotransferase-like domain-containing protein [Clostridia bacterium]
MICYLTSTATYYPTIALLPDNGFVDKLKNDLPSVMKGVFVASDPDDHAGMSDYANEMRACIEKAGFRFESFTLLDGQNGADAQALIDDADLVILAGGHVPTQNRFIQKIGLREIMQTYGGVVIGISAGTMNSADTVYAMPELEGEAIDPGFERTLTGLGLTDINIVPHYQYLETCMLDGMNMIHDIARADSMTRRLYGLPDGSYLRIENGIPMFFGKVLLMEGGNTRVLSQYGGSVSPIM